MANDMVLMNEANIKDVVSLLNDNIDKIMTGNYKKEAERIKKFRRNLYVDKPSR